MTKLYEIPFMGVVKDYINDKYGSDVRVIRASNCAEAGVSDLLLCYKGFFVAIELKTESEVSDLQIEFINEVRIAGGIGEVVDHIDWKENIDKIFQKIEDIICFFGIT